MPGRDLRAREALFDAGYRRVLRPVLFRSNDGDPELTHEQTIDRLGRIARRPRLIRALGRLTAGERYPVEIAGIPFPGRVGLAAGMDKRAVAVRAWQALGFSHVEVGTVTAHAQPGNERPRVVRLTDSRALINQMGFNNDGCELTAWTLAAAGIRRGNLAAGIPVGISLGKSRITPVEDATEDYLRSFEVLAPHADYVAVNVSSPNTPGLRSLQDGAALAELVHALTAQARERDPNNPVPVFVKLAPDLTWGAVDEAVAVCADAGVTGLIATNTTLSRDDIQAADLQKADQAGGLSGAPLTIRAREFVGYLTRTQPLPVIGVGGIMTAADAQAMFDTGATLVQLYTGFIYAGPALVRAVNALPPNQ